MNQRTLAVVLVSAGLALDACATAPSCAPVAIVVAAKERRTRVGLEPGTLQSTETGHVGRGAADSWRPGSLSVRTSGGINARACCRHSPMPKTVCNEHSSEPWTAS